MGSKKFLTDDERSEILQLRKSGLSFKSIAKTLHRSRLTITNFIKNPEEYIKLVNLANENEKLISSKNKQKPTKSKTQSNLIGNHNSKAKAPSGDEINRYNKVLVEHRAVIKYLVHKGIGPKFIYEDIQKVYNSRAPDLKSVMYWAKQYQQGRQTIVNEPKAQIISKPASKSIVNANNNTVPKNKINNSNAPSKQKSSPPPVKLKLFQFKFKPVKRSKE